MYQKAIRASYRFLAIAAAMLFALPQGRAEAIKDLPKPTNYVSDIAGVLSPETADSLNQYCSEVDHQAHAQIAVVTVKTLDGDEASAYAVKLEEAWKVGPKGSDKGVIVLLAVNDHKYWIEVGYGLEGILPDSKVGDIGQTMVPLLRSGDYDGALNGVVSQIGQTIAVDAGVTLQHPISERAPPQRHRSGSSLARLLFFGIILLIFLVVSSRGRGGGLTGFLLGMFLGGGGGGGRGGWGGGGGFGGGGGGGDSGGGGFGGFGGGSSGGGGAGGSW